MDCIGDPSCRNAPSGTCHKHHTNANQGPNAASLCFRHRGWTLPHLQLETEACHSHGATMVRSGLNHFEPDLNVDRHDFRGRRAAVPVSWGLHLPGSTAVACGTTAPDLETAREFEEYMRSPSVQSLHGHLGLVYIALQEVSTKLLSYIAPEEAHAYRHLQILLFHFLFESCLGNVSRHNIPQHTHVQLTAIRSAHSATLGHLNTGCDMCHANPFYVSLLCTISRLFAYMIGQ